MRLTSKGQVTIPQDIRELAGFLPNTEVDFEVDGDGVRIVKARQAKAKTRGDLVIETLRRGRKHITLSTDELMGLTRGEG